MQAKSDETQTSFERETPAHVTPENKDTPPSGYKSELNLGEAVQLQENTHIESKQKF